MAAHGVPCGHHRVARLRRQARLVGGHRRRPVHTTQRDPAATPAPDRVQRAFTARCPDPLGGADIPYLSTAQDEFLYLAVLLDMCSRRVVGGSMQAPLRTDLVLADLVLGALDRAVWSRRPADRLMHHADHGWLSASLLFGERCAAGGLRPSRGTVGDGSDNALVERFFATLECALLATHRFRSHDAARVAVLEWLEVCSHRQRRHSALGYQSPELYQRTVTTPGLAVAT